MFFAAAVTLMIPFMCELKALLLEIIDKKKKEEEEEEEFNIKKTNCH